MKPKKILIDMDEPLEQWAHNNRDIIMNSIYENVFDFMQSEEENRVVLQISPKRNRPLTKAQILNEPPVNVDFIITKDDMGETLDRLLEYYVKIEEYERCAKIHKLQTKKEKTQNFW